MVNAVSIPVTGGRPGFLSQQLIASLDAHFCCDEHPGQAEIAFVLNAAQLMAPNMREVLGMFCSNHFPNNRDIRDYFGLGKKRFLITTLYDSAFLPPDSSCVKGNELLVFCGRPGSRETVKVNVGEYFRFVKETIRAQWITVPFEAVHPTYTEKNISKAIQRCTAWTEEALTHINILSEPNNEKNCCVGANTNPWCDKGRIMIPIVGLDVKTSNKSLMETIRLCQGKSDQFDKDLGVFFPNLTTMKQSMRLQVVKQSLSNLHSAFPSIQHFFSFAQLGASSPTNILEILETGVDVIDSTLPYFLTKIGNALVVQLEKQGNDNDSKMPNSSDSINEWEPMNINLRDPSFSMDQSPLRAGCECFACQNHTRGYIHHLVISREMVGEMLLLTHNTFVLMELVRWGKACSATDLRTAIKRLKCTFE